MTRPLAHSRVHPLASGGPFAATDLQLLDASDLTWIAVVVDIVMSCVGLPWRTLRERLDASPIRPARAAAILAALRRVTGGRAARSAIARTIRARILGAPTLDATSRAARLAVAESELGIAADELESLLWVDLANERPVALPDGRPDERRLAAFANADRIANALRRARQVRIHAVGDALPLIRMAQRCGLLTRVTTRVAATRAAHAPATRALADHAPTDHAPTDHASAGRAPLEAARETTIDIVGPLALFHHTTVYGRALGALVPMLGGLQSFIVEVEADFGYGLANLRVASPALLPPPPPPVERSKPSISARIATALERAVHAPHRDEAATLLAVEREPPPVLAPLDDTSELLVPDLAFTVATPAFSDADSISRPRRAPSFIDADSISHPRGRCAPSDIDADSILHPRGRRAPSFIDADAISHPRQQRAPSDVVDAIPTASTSHPRGRAPSDNAIARADIFDSNPAMHANRWLVEFVGFATRELLERKLARYRSAGLDNVVLIIDGTHAPELPAHARVVRYASKTIVHDLLAITCAS